MSQADAGAFHLARSRLTAQLGHHLDDLSDSCRSRRVPAAEQAAREVYGELVLLCMKYYGNCPVTPYEQIASRVADFARFKPELFPARDVPPILTVRDYGPKVRLLGATYEIAGPEKRERAAAYSAYLARRDEAQTGQNRMGEH